MEVRALNKPRFGIVEQAQSELAAARSGDPEAFRVIFSRYSKPILSFVYSLLGDYAYAEELTQETFIRAFRNLRSMRQETHLSTWLFGIARNVVREAVRQRIRDRTKVGLCDPLSSGLRDVRIAPDQQMIALELNRTIQRALESLPEDHRIVLVLKVMHRLPYQEIAHITGATVGKLKTDMHRARLAMRQKLERYFKVKTSEKGGGL